MYRCLTHYHVCACVSAHPRVRTPVRSCPIAHASSYCIHQSALWLIGWTLATDIEGPGFKSGYMWGFSESLSSLTQQKMGVRLSTELGKVMAVRRGASDCLTAIFPDNHWPRDNL